MSESASRPGRRQLSPVPWAVTAVVAVGGGAGAATRYGAGRLWPRGVDDFPWTTLGVNATGCLLIGVLMVLTTETLARPSPLLRPFLGTGVLGGFTTFSAYGQETVQLLEAERAGAALAYLAGTVVAALAAVWLGTAATRHLVARRRAA